MDHQAPDGEVCKQDVYLHCYQLSLDWCLNMKLAGEYTQP